MTEKFKYDKYVVLISPLIKNACSNKCTAIYKFNLIKKSHYKHASTVYVCKPYFGTVLCQIVVNQSRNSSEVCLVRFLKAPQFCKRNEYFSWSSGKSSLLRCSWANKSLREEEAKTKPEERNFLCAFTLGLRRRCWLGWDNIFRNQIKIWSPHLTLSECACSRF